MGMAVDVGDRLAGDGDRRCAVGFREGLVDKDYYENKGFEKFRSTE